MSGRAHTAGILAGLWGAGLVVFGCGLSWGLPSRAADAFLFGSRAPWTGAEVQRLAGDRPDDARRGADVDADPLAPGGGVVCLNDTDAQRAAIVRRYRLYTHQPDEMITLMALASMRPREGRLDPRLYQYGGLWIYPVGAAIRLGAAAGALTLKPDVAWYLDRPEEFGKLYLAGRLYCAAWAMAGVWAVWAVTRRLTGGCAWSGAAAALCVMLMPVVVNMSHEAKPHLPGAVLMLMAVLAAMRFVETGGPGWLWGTAALCGAAFGMVLSAWPVFTVLPVMLILRKAGWERVFSRTVFGCLLGGAVYLLANPYVAINLARHPDVLRSNLGNSAAMYEVGRLGEGVRDAAWLVLEGTSPVLAVFGAGGAAWLAWRSLRRRRTPKGGSGAPGTGWLLAAPALVIGAQFAALAAGKPGEYGRFVVLPDIALAIAAIAAIRARVWEAAHGAIPVLVLAITTGSAGSEYLLAFVRDASTTTSRVQAAWQLQTYRQSGARTLGVVAEPAPYGLPPVDLFGWRILLLPAGADASTIEPIDVLVRARGTRPLGAPGALASHRSDPPRLLDLDATPISWADKRFDIQVRRRSGPP